MNHYFISLLGHNQQQSLVVKDGDHLVTFYLLQEVQNETSVKGRIIGFAKDRYGHMTAIVACYNGQIRFFSKLRVYPTNFRSFSYRPLDENRPPVSFIFKIHEIQGYRGLTRTSIKDGDKKLRLFFNIMMDSLQDKGCQILPLAAMSPADSGLMVTVNSYKINFTKYLLKTTNEATGNFDKVFGEVNVDDFVNFLREHLGTKATISTGQKNIYMISISSSLKKQVLWLQSDTKSALEHVASSNELSVSLMFQQWMTIAKIDMRTNDTNEVINKLTAAVRDSLENGVGHNG